MSRFYNPNRKSSWNYGGTNWKLSRSKIDLFLECPRCFYIDNKLGTKRPPGYPLNLNSAVDELLKKEFDQHRGDENHPLLLENGIDAHPANHRKLDDWRNWKVGVRAEHKETGMTISGAIDDLWQNEAGEYIVVDYKATAKDGTVDLKADWQITYKRQMEVYQWLLRANGLEVSDVGYFVYCNGVTDTDRFDSRLDFKISVLDYKGDDSWVEDTLSDIHECLESDAVPDPADDCDYCAYREAASEKLDEATAGQQSTLFD